MDPEGTETPLGPKDKANKYEAAGSRFSAGSFNRVKPTVSFVAPQTDSPAASQLLPPPSSGSAHESNPIKLNPSFTIKGRKKACRASDLSRRLPSGPLWPAEGALGCRHPEQQKRDDADASDVADSAAPGQTCYLIWTEVLAGVHRTCCCLNMQGCRQKDGAFNNAT